MWNGHFVTLAVRWFAYETVQTVATLWCYVVNLVSFHWKYNSIYDRWAGFRRSSNTTHKYSISHKCRSEVYKKLNITVTKTILVIHVYKSNTWMKVTIQQTLYCIKEWTQYWWNACTFISTCIIMFCWIFWGFPNDFTQKINCVFQLEYQR